jgi:ABC-2 type transport system ATP-binding protein
LLEPIMPAMELLAANRLTRRFGKLIAVDAFTVSVKAGEVFGLLGRNGAGKSTLIKMLTISLPPSCGTASVAGYDIVRQPSLARRMIGYVPQALSADGELTGYENLWAFARLFDIPRAERERRIQKALALIDLTDAADRLVNTYSGGMIRRLKIVQSMLHRPKLLFLDEPTAGLDPVAREAVWALIKRLRSDYGTTVVLTTHHMDEAEHLCTRVAILRRGKVMAAGRVAELKAAVGGKDTTLDDVFAYYTGDVAEAAEQYRDTGAVYS